MQNEQNPHNGSSCSSLASCSFVEILEIPSISRVDQDSAFRSSSLQSEKLKAVGGSFLTQDAHMLFQNSYAGRPFAQMHAIETWTRSFV